MPTLPVVLSVTVVSLYVPPLPWQSDFSLAYADGAPTVINAPRPIAAAAMAVGTNLVRMVVVTGSLLECCLRAAWLDGRRLATAS